MTAEGKTHIMYTEQTGKESIHNIETRGGKMSRSSRWVKGKNIQLYVNSLCDTKDYKNQIITVKN